MAKDPSSLYDWTLAYIIVPIPIRYNSSKPGASTLPHIGPLSSRCLKKILIQKKQFIKNYIPTMVHTTSVWPTIKALYTFVCSEIWAVLDVTQLAKAVLETFCKMIMAESNSSKVRDFPFFWFLIRHGFCVGKEPYTHWPGDIIFNSNEIIKWSEAHIVYMNLSLGNRN